MIKGYKLFLGGAGIGSIVATGKADYFPGFYCSSLLQ